MITLEQNVNGKRKLIADTFASVTSSIAVGTAMELAVGLPLDTIVKSRIINGTSSAFLGRLLGAYRDFLHYVCNVTEESSHLKKKAVDTFTTLSFWTPIYTSIQYCLGTEGEKLLNATIASAAVSAFIGAPYGWYLDRVRNWFGCPSEYLERQSNEVSHE